MVAEDGFEPPTLKVWTSCSSQLSYSAIIGGSKETPNSWPPECKSGALPTEL